MVTRKKLVKVILITACLIAIAFGASRLYIYNSDVYATVKSHLQTHQTVVSYFGEGVNLEFSIVDYSIRTRSVFGNAEFGLIVSDAEKSLSALVQLKKNTEWVVTSVEFGGLKGLDE